LADVNGLQLLPETRKKLKIAIPGQNRLLVLSLIFLALILALYGGLLVYKNKLSGELNRVEEQLVAVEKSRSKSDEEKLLRLKDQLSLVKPLIDSHISWSDGLARIQNLVNPQVQFESLNVNTTRGEYSFRAFGANYAAVAKQIAAFYTDEAIKDVSLGKVLGLPTGRVDFSIQLSLDVGKLLKKNSPEK